MSQQDTFERVQKIVAEQLGVDAAEVVPGANFANDLGADSLDTVELVMALEEEFDIEIPDDAAETTVTATPGDAAGDRVLDRDHAQLLQFPADDQGCLSLESAVLTLRQIVQRGHFVIPQMDDDFRHVHLV